MQAKAIILAATAVVLVSSAWGAGIANDRPLTQNIGRVPGLDLVPTLGSTGGTGGPDAVHTFGAVVVVDTVDSGGEPGIDVGADGTTLYENAPSGLGNTQGSYMYKSTDGGATWGMCSRTSGPGGGDSNAIITPSGVIAMNDLWLGSLTFYTSTDGCGSWSTSPVTTTYPVGDRQWVDYGPANGEFFQSWNTIVDGLHVMRTTNSGSTWRDFGVGASVDRIGNLVTDHSGHSNNVYQFYSVGGAIKVAIGKVTSGLLGQTMTFTIKTVAPAISGHDTSQQFAAGAVDKGGNVHVVWGDIAGANAIIKYAYSTNLGSTWSAAKTISTGGSNVFPWIDAGASGKVNAVWYHSDTVADPNANAGPWIVDFAQATTLNGAWTLSPATNSIHNDNICTAGTGCGSDDRDLLDFFEVSHTSNGMAVIALAKDTDANGAGNGAPRNAFVKQTAGPGIA